MAYLVPVPVHFQGPSNHRRYRGPADNRNKPSSNHVDFGAGYTANALNLIQKLIPHCDWQTAATLISE